MKLATYNLNGIRARLPRLLEWLEREKPDIVCLQELKCADEALPIADIEAAGYGAVWHGQKGFNGVAILARGDAPELRRVGLPGDPDDTHSRYIEAEVDGRRRRLALPAQRQSGRHREVRLQDAAGWSASRAHAAELLRGRAADRPLRRLERRSGGPRRLLGPRDPARRGDAAARRAQLGAGSSTRAGPTRCARFHPNESKLYTFWDYTAGCWQRDLGFRLDHLLCSPEAADRLQGAGVDNGRGRGEGAATTRRPGSS